VQALEKNGQGDNNVILTRHLVAMTENHNILPERTRAGVGSPMTGGRDDRAVSITEGVI
jgi:hypothetical protein